MVPVPSHAYTPSHAFSVMNERLSCAAIAPEPMPSLEVSLDGLDEAELDFDTAWTRFMNEQQHLSSPEPTPAVMATPPSPKVLSDSEHRRLLDARESDAFARFLDTLMLEPTSLGKSARKLEEELHHLTRDSVEPPLPTTMLATNASFSSKDMHSEPTVTSRADNSYHTEPELSVVPSPADHRPSSFRSSPKQSSPSVIAPKPPISDSSSRPSLPETGLPAPYPVYTPSVAPGVGYYPSVVPGSVFGSELPHSEQQKLFNQGYEHGYSIGFARAFDLFRGSHRPPNLPFPGGSPPVYTPLVDHSQFVVNSHPPKMGLEPTTSQMTSTMASPHANSSRNSSLSEISQDLPADEADATSSKRRRVEGSMSRLNHTQSEKRRRSVIKSLFEELGTLVPKIRESRGSISKTVSLDYTFEYIVELRRKNDELRLKLAEQGASADSVPKVVLKTSHLGAL